MTLNSLCSRFLEAEVFTLRLMLIVLFAHTQIIPTIHQAGVPPSGILLELEEIESNNEEFPLTRGFLAMIDTLTEIPVPPMLGVGYRPPGFDPYLKFLRDSVFLKFRSRAYRNPAEKVGLETGEV